MLEGLFVKNIGTVRDGLLMLRCSHYITYIDTHLAWSGIYLFPWTALRPTNLIFTPKLLLFFDSQFLVNTSRCSSQHLSVISSKHCLCLHIELRPTGTEKKLEFSGTENSSFTQPQSQNCHLFSKERGQHLGRDTVSIMHSSMISVILYII